jgi:hypothetical protein
MKYRNSGVKKMIPKPTVLSEKYPVKTKPTKPIASEKESMGTSNFR